MLIDCPIVTVPDVTLLTVRVVPLIGPVRDDYAVLLVEVPETPAVDALVFPNGRGDPLVWSNWVRRTWSPVVKGLALDYVPYELRHCFASINLLAGAPILDVSAWLGHSTPNLTLSVYGHVIARAQIDPGESVEQMVLRARAHAASLCEPGAAGT